MIEELLTSCIQGKKSFLTVSSGAYLYTLLSRIFIEDDRDILIVSQSDTTARRIADEASSFFQESVLWYPKWQFTFFDIEAESPDIRAYRTNVLCRLLDSKRTVVSTTLEGLLNPLSPPQSIPVISLKVGDIIDTDKFISDMVSASYERVPLVEGRGQFSVRGDIIDVFPANSPMPIRMELFDEEIDSIRSFDILSQRSLDKEDSVTILPMREISVTKQELSRTRTRIKDALSLVTKSSKNDTARVRLSTKINEVLDRMEHGNPASVLKNYYPFIYEGRTTVLDYARLPLVVLIEPQRILEDYNLSHKAFVQRFTSMLDSGEVLPLQERLFISRDEAEAFLSKHPLLMNAAIATTLSIEPHEIFSPDEAPVRGAPGKYDELLKNVLHYRSKGFNAVLFAGNSKSAVDIKQYFVSQGITPEITEKFNPDVNAVTIVPSPMSRGYSSEELRLAVFANDDIFLHTKRTGAPKKRGKPINSFTDFTVGDYVVHETHGIGKFLGIETMRVGGKVQDYLGIGYADGGRIFMPVEQVDLLQPYIASDSAAPSLSKIGSKEWGNAKEKAAASVKKLAFDLVELYARRQTYKGFRYSEDTPWQEEMESRFEFEETEDQLNAIDDIKRDMEDYKIMDRLLCGDVGYGKTEVALRAAFKAVMDSKQVAVLIPTTILAQQHYNTIKKRFEGFPVNIAQMSRFCSPADMKKTTTALKTGDVDIVVGTHRILSKDVAFKDLGLLIIDEEQRFGVNHKEKIKNLKKNVDVLTLSATPIPRTLHMSLIGIRDISIINIPPKDRYPVQTYVLEYNDEIFREAVLRELDRGGQAYFLYNNVANMDAMLKHLREIVPEARIAAVHGQMSENAMESIMNGFINGEYDVLLCSTIVENGIDIPNANTLFVYDADRLGLSQLYQIRGRIGRSDKIAYAYFTVKKDKVMTDVAAQRLQAIKDFTDLGSGFRIAMRDLEIRGAGNILGAEQSGHIASVGYDLYCKMLADEIAMLQGKVNEAETEVI
ncbi:MAG: transcription-repair coupling factor, partial [Clostridiales bacterium]|nr:transcription-repair coupling factor [Clostridiales bacterium]